MSPNTNRGNTVSMDIYIYMQIYVKRNYIYNSIQKLGTNYRNNFTFDYYDELIGMKDKKKILNEIKKYNCSNYDQAETIITYRNETRIKYNNMMIQKLNIKFGDVGCRVVCKSNDLKEKEIYKTTL